MRSPVVTLERKIWFGRRTFRYVFSLLVAIALLFAVSRFVDLAHAGEEFEEYPWSQLSTVLALSLAYYLIKALRWHYFLSVVGIRMSWRRSVLVYLAGQWFAITPAGEFVRAYLLARYGFSFARGSAVVAIQVLFDFLSLALVGSITLLWHQQLATLVLPFTAALILGTLALAYVPLLTRGKHLPFLAGRGASLRVRWLSFYRDTRQMLGWNPLLVGLALGLAAVAMGALVLLKVTDGYQIAADFGQSAHIYSLSQLVGGLSMLPHGLGAIEGSAIALFHYAGVDTAHGASAIALFRLATVGWSVVLGGVSMLLLRTPLAGPIPLDTETR